MISAPRIKLRCIEIYITNECNLTCSDCNRYNNYDFRGHFDWRADQPAIMAWGQRITADLITIIGGEPALHPELYQWIDLVRRAWPDISIMVQTNGTVCPQDAERITEDFAGSKFGFVASLHNRGMLKAIQRNVPDVIDNSEFMECALVDRGTYFTVHHSDPVQAFNACSMKFSHTLLHGRLFKCPMVAILPEFQKQYRVDLTPDQQQLLDGYQSLAPDCDQQKLEEFFEQEDHAISQCGLCPERHQLSPVTFDPKRKRYPRKNLSYDAS